MRKRKKSSTWLILVILILMFTMSIGYSAITTKLSMTGNVTVVAPTTPIDPTYNVNYAVQIYGINQDVDENDNPLGLTFGPATGADYNNAYVTHTYEETSSGSGVYYVKIVTHTVDSNNSETTTEEYLYQNGGTTDKVTRTTAEKNKYDINMHSMTWTQIAAVSDKTDFLDCMLCGDTKKVELSLNSTIASGTTYNQYGDGAGMLYNSINTYYRMWNPSYNNTNSPEGNNSAVGTGVTLDNNEQLYGSNARNAGGYSSSHIRATLIGENAKTNIGYAGDINLNTSNSLYTCIQSDLKNVITAKKVKYVTGTSSSSYSLNNDITDKIWAFSQREMYGTGQYAGLTTEGLGTNGDGYGKFGNTNSKYYISSYNNSSSNQRKSYNEAGTAYDWWLRSPGLDYTYYSNRVYGDGYLSNNVPNYIRGLGFGFCIDLLAGTYTINYNLDGGTVASANPATYTADTATFTLNNPTKSGYIFKGWSGTGLTGDTNTTVTIPQGSTGNRSYTANWTNPLQIGDTVNYSTSMNGVTLDNWKVFYVDGDYTTLIYGDYLPNAAIDITSSPFSNLLKFTTYGIYANDNRIQLLDAMNTKSNWDSLLTGTINGTTPVNLTRNENIWAMGSPSLDLYVNSWNAKYPADTIYTALTTSTMSDGLYGYYVGLTENPSDYCIDMSSKEGYNDTLYYPHQDEYDDCYGYWWASPCADDVLEVVGTFYSGTVNCGSYDGVSIAFRPVISVPSNILQ